MSIESKEIRDIYALYQNLSERTYAEVKAEREERIKNIKDPFRKTTIGTEDGKELKKGDPGFEDALKNARKTVRDDNNKSLGKDSDTVTSKGGTERTVKKNDDGKGITVTKKDLDSETEDLISNTPTIKGKSKFSGKEPKADLGSYKSIFDKGDNSNAKGNSIGGKNEGGPKGNPIGSSDEKKSTASGSVKFSGSQLKGLLDSQKGIGKNEKEYGGTGTKTVYNKDGSKTITKGHSDDLRSDSLGGTKASSEKGKKLLNPEKEKVTPPAPKLDRESGDPGPRTAPTSQKDEVITKPASKVITKGGPNRSGTQSSTAEKSKPQLGGHAKLNAQKIEKRRVEKIKANQPAPTEKDLEDAKKEADTANIAKLSGKYKEVPAPGPGNDGKTVLQKVKNPNPKDNKLDPTPIKKPVDTPVKTPVAKPKITARSLMRQRNIDRFGADKVNALQQKQKDFKAMQAKSMMPGAKPGAAKAEFAKKHPTSNVAKDLKKSRRVTQVMDLESYDAYDLVLNYLLETNQVDTIEEANYVMIQMDESTIQGIVNEYA